MAPSPTVSVLIPNYNGADYLASAVESVLEQNYTDFELIVLDDGSTDRSLEILEYFQKKDPRLRIEKLQHGGIVQALNYGIQAARGVFIARMDADDRMEPDRLRFQTAFCSENSNTLVGTQATLCDPKLRELGYLNPPENHDDILRACLEGMASSLMHPTLMAPKAIFETLGGYREAYRHIEDLDLYLRAAAQGFQLKNLTECVGLCYRMHAKSISNQKNQLQMDLKRKLLKELETTENLTPDWNAVEHADQMLPKNRSDFYRRWAVIAFSENNRKIAYHYLLKSLTTPPWSLSSTIDSLKLLKAYTLQKTTL